MKKNLSVIILLLIVSFSAYSQAPETIKQKTINVSGSAEMSVVPDEIYVNVLLREYDKKGGGKKDIEMIKNEFLQAATSIGIKDTEISVQDFQSYTTYYWWHKKNKNKNPDMKASITYEVKLSSSKKMDELVQKLDDEATQNFYIAKTDHSRMQEFKKQLKIQAVQAAREKADYLAAAINEKAGEALTINEPNEMTIYPQPMYANRTMMKMESMDAAGGGEESPNVDFKKMKLKFEVNAIFALK